MTEEKYVYHARCWWSNFYRIEQFVFSRRTKLSVVVKHHGEIRAKRIRTDGESQWLDSLDEAKRWCEEHRTKEIESLRDRLRKIESSEIKIEVEEVSPDKRNP